MKRGKNLRCFSLFLRVNKSVIFFYYDYFIFFFLLVDFNGYKFLLDIDIDLMKIDINIWRFYWFCLR